MSKLLSERVKKIPSTEVSTERYEFLKLSEAEPDLGVPLVDGYLLSSDINGIRTWVSPGAASTGYTGSQGTTGFVGSRGYNGSRGLQGFTGSQGFFGYTGSRGFTGSQGTTGFTGSRGFSGSQGALKTWGVPKTSNYSAVDGDRFIANTNAGSFTVTLPTPTAGAYLQIADGWNWAINNLIIDRNGATIEGIADNLAINITNVVVEFIYDGSTWQFICSAGPKGPPGVVSDDSAMIYAIALSI